MANQLTGPDWSTLLRYVDKDLEPDEARRVDQYITSHPEERRQLERLERFVQRVRTALTETALRQQPPAPTDVSQYLSPELISGYVADVLSAEERLHVEEQLRASDICLQEFIRVHEISSRMEKAELKPMPAALKQQIKALWQPQQPPVSVLVIEWVKESVKEGLERGLRIVEEQLVAPFGSFELLPQPAFRGRGDEKAEAKDLHFQMSVGEATVKVSTVQERNGLALMITLLDAEKQGIKNQRVTLRQEERIRSSDRTDADGSIHVSLIDPGIYDMEWRDREATLRLDVRAEE